MKKIFIIIWTVFTLVLVIFSISKLILKEEEIHFDCSEVEVLNARFEGDITPYAFTTLTINLENKGDNECLIYNIKIDSFGKDYYEEGFSIKPHQTRALIFEKESFNREWFEESDAEHMRNKGYFDLSIYGKTINLAEYLYY